MMRLLVFYTFLFAFGAVEFTNALQFRDCGSKIGHFTKVTVSDCDTSKTACVLVRGRNTSLTIDFVPSQDVSNIEAVVHGIIIDVPVPFPLPHADVCQDQESNIQCPIKKDTPYTYKAVLPVKSNYPKLSVNVRWQLQDENKQDIVCVLIPAKLN